MVNDIYVIKIGRHEGKKNLGFEIQYKSSLFRLCEAFKEPSTYHKSTKLK